MIELFMAGLAAGLKSYGALDAGNRRASILEQSGANYDNQADAELIKADYDVARKRETTARVIGAQKNYYLGQGFQLSGTPADVAYDSLSESEKDVYAIKLSAQMRASNYRQEANNRRQGADDARAAGKIGALTALVSFAGSEPATKFGKSAYSKLTKG